MKKIGYLFVTILLSLSCSDEKDCCSQIAGNNTLFEFSLVNQNGEDLLNENTQNSYNTNNIKLYNLIDGEEILINNPNSDSPNGYSIFEKDGNDEGKESVHRGISKRQFTKRFTLADEVVVNAAELKDGMLRVELEKIVPEAKKPRTIKIK